MEQKIKIKRKAVTKKDTEQISSELLRYIEKCIHELDYGSVEIEVNKTAKKRKIDVILHRRKRFYMDED